MRGDVGFKAESAVDDDVELPLVLQQLTNTSYVFRCTSSDVTNRFEDRGHTHKEVADGTSMHSSSMLVANTTRSPIIANA
jgi:hypothetical protein